MWFLPMVTGSEGVPGAKEGHRITQISLTSLPQKEISLKAGLREKIQLKEKF